MEAGLGTWAMENTHILTAFGDLYGIPDSPGNFDNMACNCGTHPSSFTKIKMGWVNPRDISASPSGTTVTLHALSNALRPGEAGREHAVKIPSQRSSLAYLLVEARLRTDPYERSTPGLSSGIPSEGVVVYWIDEISWPPVHLRTPTALGVGQSYTEEPLGIRIAVDSQENVGFVVTIRAVQDTKRTLKVSMEPNRPRLGMPATYTVRATDAETGVDVQGSKVTITNPSGDPQVFDVNTPFTFTFRTQRILVDPVPPRRFETIYPEGVVNAPGYLETPIDFGFV